MDPFPLRRGTHGRDAGASPRLDLARILPGVVAAILALGGILLLAPGGWARQEDPVPARFDPAQQRADPVLAAVPWRGEQVARGELLVGFSPGEAIPARDAVHRAAGATRLEEVGDGIDRVRLPEGVSIDAAVETYERSPLVRFAEPNFLQDLFDIPNDPRWWRQWGPQLVNVQDAWDVTRGDPSVVVAVVDTGADRDHPDLAGNLAYGYDFFANDPDPDDQKGHGTLVTGICGAATDNALGIASMARDCRFAIYRTGNGSLLTSAIVSSIRDARLRGYHVLNLSFGIGTPSNSMKQELNLASKAGMVLVAAAGNSGNTAKKYPAAFPNVIAVAASEPGDTRWAQSTHGSWVDVAAPGVDIHSTFPGGKYTDKSGTSFASPHVAGLAGLLYARLGGIRAKASADAIRQAIESSAVNVGNWVAHGRIDAWAALQALQPWPVPVVGAVSPSSVPALGGAGVTITGSGFATALEVNWGGVLAGPGSFTVVDDATITLSSPGAAALGPVAVSVTGAGGGSNVSSVTAVATSPPGLRVAPMAPEGAPLGWTAGGGVFDTWFLLLSRDPSTQSAGGWSVLANYQVLASGSLDAAGLAAVSFPIPTGLVGTVFYSQALDFHPGNGTLRGASAVQATAIVP